MHTFLIERPVAFAPDDAAAAAQHCRWAADAYRKAGVFWLGGVVTERRMLSLSAADRAEDLTRYARLLNIADRDIAIERVLRQIGPSSARPVE